jgi:hypothetical protein
VIVTSYNQHVRLLSPEPWLVGTTKVYSGLGADIVMHYTQNPWRGHFECNGLATPVDWNYVGLGRKVFW